MVPLSVVLEEDDGDPPSSRVCAALCISSVNCVGAGIVDPETIPNDWSTEANDNGC